MRWTKRILLILAGLLIVGLFVWAFMPKAIEVQTALVTKGNFQQIIEEEGKTRVRERYVVSAPLMGQLERITLKAGDVVKQDQVVALIVPTAPALLDARSERELTERVGTAEAQLSRSIAEVARAQAALEKSRADLNRAKKLVKENFISAAQLEQAELEFKISARDLDAARQGRHAAEHDLAVARAALLQLRDGSGTGKPTERRWQVRAPVAGHVLKVLQESEGVVAVGTPLLEIGEPRDLEIVSDILTTDAVNIKPGDPVRIERWGRPEPLEGRVRRVEPSAFTKVSALGVEEQRVNVVIDIVTPASEWSSLGDGYRVDVKVVVFSTANAIKVPVSALFRRDSQWAVFVVENGRAKIRPIELAHRSGLDAMVTKGLQPDERVIVYPGDRVRDGAKVKLK
jgi:HlyD family secretion protein